jgi:hypothetical protein
LFDLTFRSDACVWARHLSFSRERKKKEPAAKPKPPPRAKRAVESPAKKQVRVVKIIIQKVEAKLQKEVAKATLGDYIKLLQLEKDLEEGEQREIKVTWVEPVKTESENGQ